MPKRQKIGIRCYDDSCASNNPYTFREVEVSGQLLPSTPTYERLFTCDYCSCDNIVTLPRIWGPRGVLEGYKPLLYYNKIPILQGKKPK